MNTKIACVQNVVSGVVSHHNGQIGELWSKSKTELNAQFNKLSTCHDQNETSAKQCVINTLKTIQSIYNKFFSTLAEVSVPIHAPSLSHLF